MVYVTGRVWSTLYQVGTCMEHITGLLCVCSWHHPVCCVLVKKRTKKRSRTASRFTYCWTRSACHPLSLSVSNVKSEFILRTFLQ